MSQHQQVSLNRIPSHHKHSLSPIYRGFLLLPACALALMAGCGVWDVGTSITGSGRTVTNTFDLAGFSKVEAGSTFQVKITRGETHGVAVTVDDNVVDYLDVTRSGDTLHLGLKANTSFRNVTLKAEITSPELSGLDLSGASHTTVTGFNSDRPLDVELSGASHLRGTIQSGDTRFRVSGASHAEIDGKARNLKADVSGASTVNLGGYASENAVVKASGASHVTVNTSGKLDADASGASSIRYLGQPSSVNSRVSGASSVKQK